MPNKRVSPSNPTDNENLIRTQWPELIRQAIAVRKKAYAPYSKFKVGAALLTEQGNIFTGCNVENASYGLTICAERTAIVTAVAQGHQKFLAIAVAADPLAAPCGACRQFIFQFGKYIVVRAFDIRNSESCREWTSGELLPNGFEF